MDIKTLLLKSLSLRKPMHGSRRIHCGKSSIIIKYVINGNIFNIKAIKINRTHENWAQRMKYYKNELRTYRSTKPNFCTKENNPSITFCKETLTENLNKHTTEVQTEEILKNSPLTKRSISTQTVTGQKHAKEIQTEPLKSSPKLKEIFKLGATTKSKPIPNQSVALTTTAQQTIASARFSRSISFNNKILYKSKTTSTVSNTENKAIQCKRSTQAKSCNTDTNTRDSCAQVEHDLPAGNNSLPEELKKRFPFPTEEFGIFIYMLNEIGETVINQNQILKSNTEMIKHIIQISLLQNSKRMNNNNASCRSTQTEQLPDIEKKNNFSQTNIESTKQRRKLQLFKGRNSQHKELDKFLTKDKNPG